MKLQDLMPIEDWAALEAELTEKFGLQATAYNADGLSFSGKPRFVNDLCRAIKANKTSLSSICAPGNQNFMAQAKSTGKTVIAECDAGFVKVAVPVFVAGEFLGTVGGCGRLPVGGEVETFLVTKTAGLSDDEIAGLSRGIREISDDEARNMAAYIEERLALIVARAQKSPGN